MNQLISFTQKLKIFFLSFLIGVVQTVVAQNYCYVDTKQGNDEAWSSGVFNQGTTASQWTGTGSITYSTWGSLGYGISIGSAYWSFTVSKYACNIKVRIYCVSKKSWIFHSEDMDYFVRRFDNWSWVQIGTVSNIDTPSYFEFTVSNSLYIRQNDGRFDVILQSDDEYVIDKIEVYQNAPPGSFILTTELNTCGYAKIDWTSPSCGASYYTIKRDGTTIVSSTTSTTFTDNNRPAGTYNYCVDAINSTCSSHSRNGCINATVLDLPGQAVINGGSTNACQGNSITFTSSAQGSTNFNWTAPSDWSPNSGTGSSFTTTVGNTSGDVTVTPSNSCGNGPSASTSVTVNSVPGNAPITGSSNACQGDKLTYKAFSPGATDYNWTAPSDWSPNSGTGSSFITTVGTLSGEVKVTPKNNCGDGQETVKNVNVSKKPGIPTIEGPNDVCEEQKDILFSANADLATSYTWEVPSGWTITSGNGTSDIYVTVGSISGNVSVVPRNNCDDGPSGDFYVTVTKVPDKPTISGNSKPNKGDYETYYASAANATNYSWEFPSDWVPNTGSGASITTKVSSSGNITATPSNNCGDGQSSKFYVQVKTSGIAEGNLSKPIIKVYPNPVKDVLTIECPVTIIHTEIFNVLGKKLISTNNSIINVRDLDDGIYIIKTYNLSGQIIYVENFLKINE